MKQHCATSRDHSKNRGSIVGSYVGWLWHSLSGSGGTEPNSAIHSLGSFRSPERLHPEEFSFTGGTSSQIKLNP